MSWGCVIAEGFDPQMGGALTSPLLLANRFFCEIMFAFFSSFWQNKLTTLWESGKTSWLLYGKVAKQVGYFMGKWQNKFVTLWKVAKQAGYFVGDLFAQNLTEHNRKICEQTSGKIIGKMALEFSV